MDQGVPAGGARGKQDPVADESKEEQERAKRQAKVSKGHGDRDMSINLLPLRALLSPS